jgi:SAM-dependent methyltransferase
LKTPYSRLNPPRHHSRYYVLTGLRKALIEALSVQAGEQAARGQLLDYGCGEQPYRPLVEAQGWQYVGADMPPNPLADVLVGESGSLPLADASVAVVLSSQVLEHVPNPVAYLQECRRVLCQGGCLILSTHGYWMYHPHPTDYWRWTQAGLRKLLQDHGWQVVEERCVMGLTASGLQLFQDGLMPRLPRWLHRGFAWTIQRLQAWVDARERFPHDAAVFVMTALPAPINNKTDG